MPGIAKNSVTDVQARIARFSPRYIADWDIWMRTPASKRPEQLGITLRKWQACRPNRMRRIRAEATHSEPYLEDLVSDAIPHLKQLETFNLCIADSFTSDTYKALENLWDIFELLAYHGRANNGLAGIVGISKAVMLLTEGRVGPAFDSNVKTHLSINEIQHPSEWMDWLSWVHKDIQAFEKANGLSLHEALPAYSHIKPGRLYDMVLGPGNP